MGVFCIKIEASRWRGRLEGRAVSLFGPLRLHLKLWATLLPQFHLLLLKSLLASLLVLLTQSVVSDVHEGL